VNSRLRSLPAITLSMVGDVMLGRGVNELLREVSAEYPWGNTLSVLRSADWRMCNLECAISDAGTPWARTEKAFHFRSDAKNVAVLQAASIDTVSAANNHILDYDVEAMLDTLENLKRAGIGHAGAGCNLEAAVVPAISSVRGARIGLISFTDNQPEWEAGANREGVFYVPIDADNERAQLLFQTVRLAAHQTDLLIVSPHWGPNWGYEPPPAHLHFARRLVDSGADIIFGHSGHVFRGIEFYCNRPIIYCAGNFIDDYAVDEVERNDESFIFRIVLRHGRIFRLALFPTVISDCQARGAAETRASEIAAKMSGLCEGFGTRTTWNKSMRALEVFA